MLPGSTSTSPTSHHDDKTKEKDVGQVVELQSWQPPQPEVKVDIPVGVKAEEKMPLTRQLSLRTEIEENVKKLRAKNHIAPPSQLTFRDLSYVRSASNVIVLSHVHAYGLLHVSGSTGH